ncbi:MAG: hypothetical protein IKV33_03565 [Alistipes sp.]|nr:hypothetical protein [Alistipes sp.]
MRMVVDNDTFFAEVDRLLVAGESVTIKVQGVSMMPLLRDGVDSVVLRRHVDEDIKLGAVMFFCYRGKWFMHRLCRIDGDVLYFAGDGNYRQWECVCRTDVKGVVTAVVSKSGRVKGCDSLSWRVRSKMWLMLPSLVRRYILAIIRRIKF